jgi:hypothetical protein
MSDTKIPAVTPKSAPSIGGELTPEQRRQRYAELRARAGRSLLETEAPAGKTGYWARREDKLEMYRLKTIGFEIVHDNPTSPAWKAGGLQSDGTYVVGDVILMEIDTELYEMYKQDNVDRSNAMMDVRKAFHEKGAEQGVPTFEVSPKRG